MYCRKCGSLIPDDSKFCSCCGELINSDVISPNEFYSGPITPLLPNNINDPYNAGYNQPGYNPYEYGKINYNNAYATPPKKKSHGCLTAFLICAGTLLAINIIGFFVAYSLEASSANTSATTSQSISSKAPDHKPDLELTNDKCVVDEAGAHVTGIVKNNTSKQYSYVQIQFALYDKSGNQVGTALANINGLEPGGTWKFDAVAFAPDTTKYKLLGLTGF